MNRRAIFAGLLAPLAALLLPKKAEAGMSSRCVCPGSYFERVNFGGQVCQVCTRCGLVYLDRLKRSNPS